MVSTLSFVCQHPGLEPGLGPLLSCLPSHITTTTTTDAARTPIRLSKASHLQRSRTCSSGQLHAARRAYSHFTSSAFATGMYAEVVTFEAV